MLRVCFSAYYWVHMLHIWGSLGVIVVFVVIYRPWDLGKFSFFFITLFRRKSEFSPPHCRYESIGAIFMAVGPLFRRFLDSGRLDHP